MLCSDGRCCCIGGRMIWRNFNRRLMITRGRNRMERFFGMINSESFLIGDTLSIIFAAVPINRNQVCYPPLFRVWKFVSRWWNRCKRGGETRRPFTLCQLLSLSLFSFLLFSPSTSILLSPQVVRENISRGLRSVKGERLN